MLEVGLTFNDIHIEEVFDYYDQPILFTCSYAAQQYLVVFISDGREIEKWLFSPITPEILEMTKNNRIDLQTAFLRASGGTVYIVGVNKKTSQFVSIEERPVGGLTEEELPLSGEYLV